MGLMGLAESIRLQILTILQSALNEARANVRTQLVSGQVNPVVARARTSHDQGGFTPTKVDAHMDRYIETLVRTAWPNAHYTSEELERTTDLDERQIVFSCDPVDGTTNAFTILGKWSIVLFADMFLNGRLVHLAGGIAMSDGEIITWQNFQGRGEVWVEFPADYTWPTVADASRQVPDRPGPFVVQLGEGVDRGPYPGKARRFGSVAHSVERRRLLASAFDLMAEPPGTEKDAQVWLSSIGGNAIASALLLGELGASIETKAVKLIDAAYVIPLVLAGGVVVDLDDRGNVDIWERFADTGTRRIGPFIAAASEEAVKELVSRRIR